MLPMSVCHSLIVQFVKKKIKFLNKLLHTERWINKRFSKNICDELTDCLTVNIVV